jgi:hypothetical protein
LPLLSSDPSAACGFAKQFALQPKPLSSNKFTVNIVPRDEVIR